MANNYDHAVKLTQIILECLGLKTGVFSAVTGIVDSIKSIVGNNEPDEKQMFIKTLEESVRKSLYAENPKTAEEVYVLLSTTFQKHFQVEDIKKYYRRREEWCSKLTAKHFTEKEQHNNDVCAHFRTALKGIIDAIYEQMNLFGVYENTDPVVLDTLFQLENMLALYHNVQEQSNTLLRYRGTLPACFDTASLPELQDRCSGLYYLNKNIGLHGREAEKQRIRTFIGGDEPVRIWCIAGDGGVGKSKLAWYAADECRDVCTPVWLDDTAFTNLLAITPALTDPPYHKTVLFICDYANTKQKKLCQLIRHMRNSRYTCRFLLLARLPQWYENFRENEQGIADCFWRDPSGFVKALDLSQCLLPDEACQKIVQEYCDTKGKTLTADEVDRIIAHARSLESSENHRKMRCLYLLLTADAYLEDGALHHWKAEELVNRYIDRSVKQLEKLYPKEIVASGMRLLALATVLGGLDMKQKYSEAIQNDISAIKRHFPAKKDLRNFLCELSDTQQQDIIIQPLYPDIVGEYLFLSQYNDLWEEAEEWNTLILKSDHAETCLHRCLHDWTGEELMRAALLALAETDAVKIQRIIRDALVEQYHAETSRRLLAHMKAVYEAQPSAETAAPYSRGIDHLHSITHAPALLEDGLALAESLEGREDGDTAAVYHNIGSMYQYRGDYDNALVQYQKALAIQEKVLGTEHPDTATTYHNIGMVYKAKGDYDNALVQYQKALAIREKVLDTEHPDTAATYNNIGLVYDAMGDYDNALVQYQKSLQIKEKVLGTEHPDTATTYHNIAGVHYAKGDYDNALVQYQKALVISEKVLGTEHPNTATTYNNIAGVYAAKGDYDNALVQYQKALAIREKVLGTEHPSTATTYNNIAGVYYEKGDYDNALMYYQKALAIVEKVLGTEHPDTATTYNNIGSVYKAKGDYDNALKYYLKDLAISEKVLGTEHPDTATTYNNIGLVYDAMGDYDNALVQYQKALAIREKVLGTEHPSTAISYHNIGTLYVQWKDYPTALAYLKKEFSVFAPRKHPSAKLSLVWILAIVSKLPEEEQGAVMDEVLGIENAPEIYETLK